MLQHKLVRDGGGVYVGGRKRWKKKKRGKEQGFKAKSAYKLYRFPHLGTRATCSMRLLSDSWLRL